MNKLTKKDIEIKELKNRVVILESQMLSSSFFAYQQLNGLSGKYKGSGIILELKDLKGKSIVNPVLISDGLSEESIIALKSDLVSTNNSKLDFVINKLVTK